MQYSLSDTNPSDTDLQVQFFWLHVRRVQIFSVKYSPSVTDPSVTDRSGTVLHVRLDFLDINNGYTVPSGTCISNTKVLSVGIPLSQVPSGRNSP